jgi:hypothetical protein
MNIFALDENPMIAAQMHCDKHVVKMILESAQILSTVHHLEDVPQQEYMLKHLYKPTHKNHPCTIWARENTANYHWLARLYYYLGCEYTYRYGKEHKSMELNRYLSKTPYSLTIESDHTPFALAMPDQYKYCATPVDCYQLYYRCEKSHILQYTKRAKPDWLWSTGH